MQTTKRVILYLSLLSFCILLYNSIVGLSPILIPLIPLIFGVSYWYIIPKKAILGSGLMILTIVETIRYIIYPLLFRIDSCDYEVRQYIDSAILLMILEILVINVTIAIYYRRKPYHKLNSLRIEYIPPYIPIILLVFILFVFLTQPMIFANKHFVLVSESIKEDRIDTNISGVISQLVRWGQIFGIAFLFYLAYRKYKETNKKLFFWISIIIVLYPCLFYTGSSRLSLLMPVVCAIFVLRKAYGAKVKKLTYAILSYGILALLSLSLMKFWGASDVSSVSGQIGLETTAKLFNAYFGGIENVAIGLKAFANYGSSLQVLINDCLRNAMGISSFFVENPDNSVKIFNDSFYGHNISFSGDQICPTIIEGLLMFGPVFCILPTVIMVSVLCWLDYNWQNSTNICVAYLCANIASLMGWAIPGNFMHLTTNMFNCFLPVYILILLNSFLKKIKW